MSIIYIYNILYLYIFYTKVYKIYKTLYFYKIDKRQLDTIIFKFYV